MRDGLIEKKFNDVWQAMKILESNINNTGGYLNQNVMKLQRDMQIVTIYLEAIRDYEKKWWFLPKEVFPGNKVFNKLYMAKIAHYQKIQTDQITKAQTPDAPAEPNTEAEKNVDKAE